MTRKIMWLLASSGLLLGVLHLALTLPIYRRLSLEALWFAGSGLAIVCCALVNVVALRSTVPAGRWVAVIANLLVSGFFAAAWPLLPGPQVAAGFMIFVVLAAYSGLNAVRPAKAAQLAPNA